MDEILDEKTYETRTVQYAGFILRTSAFFLDMLFLILITYGLLYVFEWAPSYGQFLKTYWWKLSFIIIFYYLYFDGSDKNATPGKQIMNIRLLDEEKREIDFMRSALHFAYSVVLFFGYIKLFSDPKQQTWADKLSKVIVVKVK